MTPTTSNSNEVSLTSTLVLALTQCQEQVRQLAEQSKKVDDLTRENENLRRQLEVYRSNRNEDLETRYRTQFQDAFKQVAEKQAEVDRLKEKLRNVKMKVRRSGLTEPISSSAISSSDVGLRSPCIPPPRTTTAVSEEREEVVGWSSGAKQPIEEAIPQSRKRLRTSSQPPREPLAEVSGNTTSDNLKLTRTRNITSRRQDPKDKGAAAIPELAEDGDEHLWKRRKTNSEHKAKAMAGSVYHRLGDLLEARVPASPVLLRARSGSPPLKNPMSADATPARPSSASIGLPTPSTGARSKRPRSSLAEIRKAEQPDPDDEEPFRSKPLDRLGLKHFKLNPATNKGIEYAYNQVIRGQERKCFPGCTRECCSGTFKALAATLPNAQNLNGQSVSDDELLLNFLGPGSEERIRNLTTEARENLIHDARIRLVADAFGKMHRNAHERGRSPPGFWRTDMPGSQEQKEDRQIAKVIEREEVARRYHEAMKEGGRWIFADE